MDNIYIKLKCSEGKQWRISRQSNFFFFVFSTYLYIISIYYAYN